jgi:hypothetical protein
MFMHWSITRFKERIETLARGSKNASFRAMGWLKGSVNAEHLLIDLLGDRPVVESSVDVGLCFGCKI